MSMHDTETSPAGHAPADKDFSSDPVWILIRISAVLSVVMAVAGGVLIWRARDAAGPRANARNEQRAAISDDAPVYDLNVTPVDPARTSAGMAESVADFELTERSGETVTNADLLGQPWAVSFIFTHCAGPCPRVTGQMKLLQDRFEDRPVRLVTITVDPERDTVQRLAGYADNFGADEEQWLFLTGDQETIYPLIRDSFGLSVQEVTGPDRKPGWEIIHSTRVVHVDAEGRIRGKYNALDAGDMSQLVRALETDLEQRKAAGADSGPSTGGTTPISAPVPMAGGN